jgi:hypothetical protein
MGSMVRWIIAVLSQHLLLVLGLFALLPLIAVFWNAPAWLLAALALLQQHHPVILVIVGGAVSVGVLFLVLWQLPKWQASGVQDIKDRLTIENAARQTLAQIIGGIAVIAGLFFTWVNLQYTQASARETIRISDEGQITERFTKAIDHLGAVSDKGEKQLEIRLGGIYALERIAKDSERDHWPIMEILTAYVREKAMWTEDPSTGFGKTGPNVGRILSPHQRSIDYMGDPPPDPDIQAILSVLGRRTRIYQQGEDQPLNLRQTDLRRADLQGSHLEGAVFIAAHLERANLRGAHLRGADLRDASGLTWDQFRNTFGIDDKMTKLPAYLQTSRDRTPKAAD